MPAPAFLGSSRVSTYIYVVRQMLCARSVLMPQSPVRARFRLQTIIRYIWVCSYAPCYKPRVCPLTLFFLSARLFSVRNAFASLRAPRKPMSVLQPVSRHTTLSISIYYSPNHLYVPRTVTAMLHLYPSPTSPCPPVLPLASLIYPNHLRYLVATSTIYRGCDIPVYVDIYIVGIGPANLPNGFGVSLSSSYRGRRCPRIYVVLLLLV